MQRAALFISDLHMGAGDELEDFIPANEDAFVRFLERQSSDLGQTLVDLVVLGDGFDIWQVAEEQEKTAPDSESIPTHIDRREECLRAQQIAKAHPQAFEAFRRFLEVDPERRRLVFVIGNHDHSLVDPDVSAVIRRAVAGSDAPLQERIFFEEYYDAPELKTYAEHGNQYDANNCYGGFSSFGDECPGYFFVRLFWNRLEYLEPNLDIWFRSFSLIWRHRLWQLIVPAYRFYRQYREDGRKFERIDIPVISHLARDVSGVDVLPAAEPIPDFPELLFSSASAPALVFSRDPGLETRLRTLYHDPANVDFRNAVDSILAHKNLEQSIPLPEEVSSPRRFASFFDPYRKAVEGMFAPTGEDPKTTLLRESALQAEDYAYVLLGHTHAERRRPIGSTGATYFNSGTWAVQRDEQGAKTSRLTYVLIGTDASGTVEAKMDVWV